MTARVATYYRISADPLGKAEGIARQRQDCRARVEREGWLLAAEHEDNDISAAGARKPRPGYDEMMRRAWAGEYDVILAYSNSRLTRRMSELEQLITLFERTGTQIRTVVSGDDDLSTADGRMVARIKASVDSAEAERVSERARRAKKAKKDRGEYAGGARRFGFGQPLKITTNDGRVILSAQDRNSINEAEAALIRSGAVALLAGTGLIEVARVWQASGVTGVRGGKWQRTQVRDTLLDAGNVPAILDADTYATVKAILSANHDHHARGSAPKYWLSGIAECAICGSAYEYLKRGGNPRGYRCSKCKSNSIKGEAAERTVSLAVAQWYTYGRRDLDQHPTARTITDANTDLAPIIAELDELQTGIDSGDLAYSKVQTRIRTLRQKAQPLYDEIEQLRQSDAHTMLSEAAVAAVENELAGGIGAGKPFAKTLAILERWEALSVPAKKQLLRANFRVVIKPGHQPEGRVSVTRNGLELA